jgi:hypothetical protein
MGVFGQVEIIIECKTSEFADEIGNTLEADVSKYIKENTEYGEFHLGFDDVDGGDTCIIVQISSGRVQHAEWQGEMILEYLLAKHKEKLDSVNGEVTTPDNYLYWSEGDED